MVLTWRKSWAWEEIDVDEFKRVKVRSMAEQRH